MSFQQRRSAYFNQPRNVQTDTPSGDMSGSTTLTFTTTGVLTGEGALTGSTTLTFSPSATIQGLAPISGSATLTFSPTGTIIGVGALSGSSTITFSPTATLTGTGALSGSTTLTFGPTATLAGGVALSDSATITFSVSGTLEDAGSGVLSGSTSITFTATGVLTGTGDLAGSTTLTFSTGGTLGSEQVITQSRGGFDPSRKPSCANDERDEDKRELRELIEAALVGEKPTSAATHAVIAAPAEVVSAVEPSKLNELLAMAQETSARQKTLDRLSAKIEQAIQFEKIRRDDEELIELLGASGLLQ